MIGYVSEKSDERRAEQFKVISEPTVCTHVSNILGKLHLVGRTQAAFYALRERLASLDDTAEAPWISSTTFVVAITYVPC
jgi:hypothetical protein